MVLSIAYDCCTASVAWYPFEVVDNATNMPCPGFWFLGCTTVHCMVTMYHTPLHTCPSIIVHQHIGYVLTNKSGLCRYVMDVYMPRDRMNRAEHRGFGFVTFETEAAIIRIASYGGHMIRFEHHTATVVQGLSTAVHMFSCNVALPYCSGGSRLPCNNTNS